MSDYIYQKFGKIQPLWEVPGVASINLQLVHDFEQTLPKGDQPFQLYTFPNTKWYQGNYHARRTEGTWCDSSRL